MLIYKRKMAAIMRLKKGRANMKYFLSIDIGASSGRHIIGYEQDGELMTDEVYRFPNGMDEVDGHLVWDTDRLFREIKAGIKIAFEKILRMCYT